MRGTGTQWVINAVGTYVEYQNERFQQLNIDLGVNLSGCTYKRQGLNQIIQN